MKEKQNARVLSQRETAPQIYDMWIETGLAAQALPGQFICVYPKVRSTLLPRPISICEVNADKTALRIVYRIAGQGTAEFSRYREGDSIAVMGTLGNGFPLQEEKAYFIENIDATVIAQRPKLAPYIPEMKKNIARVLGIQEGQVNVKATTEEGLGFTGEGLGISASAVCLLSEIQNYVGADVLMEDRDCAGCGGCARFGGI